MRDAVEPARSEKGDLKCRGARFSHCEDAAGLRVTRTAVEVSSSGGDIFYESGVRGFGSSMATEGLQSGCMAGQGGGVPETMEKRRRWSGYVCPDCRFVFRIPGDHDGKGVVCPGCRRMLRIPSPGERLPPLVVPLKGTSPEVAAPGNSGPEEMKRRRKTKSRHSDSHVWDKEPADSSGVRRGERRQMRWMMIGGATLFTLIVAGVVAAMFGGDKPVSPAVNDGPSGTSIESGEVAAPVRHLAKSDSAILDEAEPVIQKFLEATRLEEMLSLVRNPDVAEGRMRRYYPNGTIKAAGVAKFNTRSELARNGAILSVGVRTRDFEERSISFFDTPEGIKIDWESWAGWSEMPWEEFLTSRPSTAKVFRVKLSEVDYYNFFFADEGKWRSYRLDSPDEQHSVFGYAERGTVLDSTLRPSADVKEIALMLSLKFPDEEGPGKQVIIEKIITEGWVEEGGEAP